MVIIEQDDIIVTLNYYSCFFADTLLDKILKENKINEIFIGGLTITNCVKFSAIQNRR